MVLSDFFVSQEGFRLTFAAPEDPEALDGLVSPTLEETDVNEQEINVQLETGEPSVSSWLIISGGTWTRWYGLSLCFLFLDPLRIIPSQDNRWCVVRGLEGLVVSARPRGYSPATIRWFADQAGEHLCCSASTSIISP